MTLRVSTPILREGEHWFVTPNLNQNFLGKCMIVLSRDEELAARFTCTSCRATGRRATSPARRSSITTGRTTTEASLRQVPPALMAELARVLVVVAEE